MGVNVGTDAGGSVGSTTAGGEKVDLEEWELFKASTEAGRVIAVGAIVRVGVGVNVGMIGATA